MKNNSHNADFILASASPRRRDLLRQIGLSFRVVPSRLSESNQAGMEPHHYALHWAAAKAKDVAERFPNDWVLGADTSVVLDGEILGKPGDSAEAFRVCRPQRSSLRLGPRLGAIRVVCADFAAISCCRLVVNGWVLGEL